MALCNPVSSYGVATVTSLKQKGYGCLCTPAAQEGEMMCCALEDRYHKEPKGWCGSTQGPRTTVQCLGQPSSGFQVDQEPSSKSKWQSGFPEELLSGVSSIQSTQEAAEFPCRNSGTACWLLRISGEKNLERLK